MVSFTRREDLKKMASPSYANSPCAACKFLRRKCISGCIFAPYFPPEEPQKFAYVHKIFGASNVSKLLLEIPPHQREDAVNSLAYEADARIKDPVYGCVGAISVLQQQVIRLQKELDATNASLLRYTSNNDTGITMPSHSAVLPSRQVRSSQGNYSFSHSSDAGDSLPYNFPFTFNHDPGDSK